MKYPPMLSFKQKKAAKAGVVTIFAVLAILAIDDELESYRDGYAHQVRRRKKAGRGLSFNLGGGDCEWKAPVSQVPEEVDFTKILLVGFPSEKHLVSAEMEGLSGLPSKDDWDFVHNGYTNTPFIKTNYPHPSGIWSFDDHADQVALVVQSIRKSMSEYSDMYWSESPDSEFEKDKHMDNIESFYTWRDQHVILEIYKYGWYIDYWLENGLLRDPYTHRMIDEDNWKLHNSPEPIKNDQDRAVVCHRTSSKNNPLVAIEISKESIQNHLDNGAFLGTCQEASKDLNFMSQKFTNAHDSPATQDPNCDRISEGCKPAIIISADKVTDDTEGPKEGEIIGNFLMKNEKMTKWIIKKEAWDCVWGQVLELMDSEEPKSKDTPNFSKFMLQEMKNEVQRLVDKYSADPWTEDANAKRVVSLLSEHLTDLQAEIHDIESGKSTLSFKDIYGPGERIALSGKTTE